MSVSAPRWDIFCTVIDNYGDAGVAWRLARQLCAEHSLRVCLWIDDLQALGLLCPALNPALSVQWVHGVEVRYWGDSSPVAELAAADVVVEAFGCRVPPEYLQAMVQRQLPPLWLNLEYLTAEDWAASCHGLASLQGNGLRKHFFFPGFSASTGGLLREAGLLEQCYRFQSQYAEQRDFAQRLGFSLKEDSFRVSLFSYECNLDDWLHLLAGLQTPTQLLVPQGKVLTSLQESLGYSGVLTPGGRVDCGNLEIVILPFMAQADFDRLLWLCHFNIVRGEDSFVRAQWAGRPFLWHIYPQEGGAHLSKLDAFLSVYGSVMPVAAALATGSLWKAWNRGMGIAEAWERYQKTVAYGLQSELVEKWRDQLTCEPDLASALVSFCNRQVIN